MCFGLYVQLIRRVRARQFPNADFNDEEVYVESDLEDRWVNIRQLIYYYLSTYLAFV